MTETTTEQLAEIEEQAAEYTPPDGWRVLQVGDVLEQGDEIVQSCDGQRYRTERAGSIVGANQRYIRRIELQPQPDAALQGQLAAVKAQLATVAAERQRLQIELDAAQQVPQAIADRFEEGWNHGTARAVESIIAWLEPFRGCNSPALAALLIEALPDIMRHLTGLTQD